MSDSPPQRILALDGFRGLAIVLVMFNHLPLNPIYAVLPQVIHPWAAMLTANGKIGVGMFFVLSGFLMATIYAHPSSSWRFWQKRYTRIFPLFLTMVLGLSVSTMTPWLGHPVARLLILLTLASVNHFLWLKLKKVTLPNFVHTWLRERGWNVFLFFQACVALGYGLIYLKVPAAVYYQVWPVWQQQLVTGLVNATLTLPVGRFVAQLDGVYWSLATEILFYLLYPLLVIPLVAIIKHKATAIVVLATLLSLLPAFMGLREIGRNLLGFDILQIQLGIYFMWGVGLAHLLSAIDRAHTNLTISAILRHPLTSMMAVILVLANTFAYHFIPSSHEAWIIVAWVIPISLLFSLCSLPQTSAAKWFSHSWLQALGKISFSMYLSHGPVIGVVTSLIQPTSVISSSIVVILSWFLTIVVSHFLFWALEAPYFTKSHRQKMLFPNIKEQQFVKTNKKTMGQYLALFSLTAGTAFLLFFSFRSPVSFFATSSNHPSQFPVYSITQQPLVFPFQANHNNLGMIFLNLRTGKITSDISSLHVDEQALLSIKLVEKGLGQLAENKYPLGEIGESHFHPFGFPVQPDSSQKEYQLHLHIEGVDESRPLELVTQDTLFKTVYLVNRANLLSHPVLLIQHVWQKIVEPWQLAHTWHVLFLFIPLLSILWTKKLFEVLRIN